ncbi:response regulator [Halovulum dunhuangense]|uniref:Response regulator n=1 Tax=Halovulum dunhuangense TaxID=1505036 RepID=A0A849L092_9RHOB|nr:response regulator [Halovulum dunhuangense]
MRVLVVHENGDLCGIWARFLKRSGFSVKVATSPADAEYQLASADFDVLVVEPELEGHGGLSVADMATFRNPEIRILAVTASSFFSEGTIFDLIPNARGVLRTPVRLEDLGAYIDHFSSWPQREAPARPTRRKA